MTVNRKLVCAITKYIKAFVDFVIISMNNKTKGVSNNTMSKDVHNTDVQVGPTHFFSGGRVSNVGSSTFLFDFDEIWMSYISTDIIKYKIISIISIMIFIFICIHINQF